MDGIGKRPRKKVGMTRPLLVRVGDLGEGHGAGLEVYVFDPVRKIGRFSEVVLELRADALDLDTGLLAEAADNAPDPVVCEALTRIRCLLCPRGDA